MKNIERIVISSFVAVCFCLTPEIRAADPVGTTASTTDTSRLSNRDTKFLREAAQGNLAEQRIGQLAQEKSQNAQVKEFGRKLMSDHAKSQQELLRVAQSKGLSLPMTIDRSHEKKIEHLQSLSAADFDRTALHDMVRDHEKDVREFERESKKADDADIRNFASSTLPTLQDHLNQARSLYSSVGGTVREPAGAQPHGKQY